MEETEEEDISKVRVSERFQRSFSSTQTSTHRVERRTISSVTTSSSASNIREVFSPFTERLTSSLDDSNPKSSNIVPESRSFSASSLFKNKKPPEKSLRDQVTITELQKDPENKTYRTTASLDFGKPVFRQPVMKSDSIKEEGQENVIITEPDDKEGSIDKSEDSNPYSDDLNKSSQEDLPKGFLSVADQSISRSSFQGISRSHSSLDEGRINITEQKSLENLTVSGRRQIVHGSSMAEESTHVSGTKGIVVRSLTGQENRQQWLTTDTGSTNVNSRSMESLRENRASFITNSEKDMRRVVASSVEARSLESLEKEIRMMGNRYRRTVSGEDVGEAEKKRGLFASARSAVPSHLSLMPPQFVDRRLTILSPHSPMIHQLPTPGSSSSTSEVWQFTTQTLKTRRKKAVVLPRLVLPGAEDVFAG